MLKDPRVVVVGATGAVGKVALKVLKERHFPLESLRVCASPSSLGGVIPFLGQDLIVEEANAALFAECDLAFISVSTKVSLKLGRLAVDQGCVVIDDSSAYRMEPGVPLVVPEINGDDVEWHKGILSIPNCVTTPLVMALWPLHQVNPVKRIIVATYQSVSGTGAAAMEELKRQISARSRGRKRSVAVYPHQIAFNVLPQVDDFLESGYTVEEQKLLDETRKIMREPGIAISATCVRVPVQISHSEAVHVEFERPMSPDEARELLAAFPGVTVVDDPARSLYPMPIDATGKDDVFVGRIRADVSNKNGLVMWVVFDNLRKGAATNAIQIAEEVVKRNCFLR